MRQVVQTFLQEGKIINGLQSANKIVVSDYDFDAIKTNLKNFLQVKQSFKTTILKVVH